MTTSNAAVTSVRPTAPEALFGLWRLALRAYVITVILLVTLLPFRFHWPTVLKIMWSGTSFDFLTNVVLFMPLGFLAALTQRRHDQASLWRSVGLGVSLSLGIEMAQLGLPGRYSSLFDVLSNGCGTWLGALLYQALRHYLQQRLLGRLALELPLMQLVYLLLPQLWLSCLAAGAEPVRLGTTVLLGLCGGHILVVVWRHRLHPQGVLSARTVWLVVVTWFLLGTLPAWFAHPLLLIAYGATVVLLLRWQTGWGRPRQERRFEISTLNQIAPLYAIYVLLTALWPWPWIPGHWQASLGFASLADTPGVLPVLRTLECLGAFTLLGYMVAEYRGRQEAPWWNSMTTLAIIGLGSSGGLEILRGFHPHHTASLAQALVATSAVVYGGLLYRLHLTLVQSLLQTQAPTTPHSCGTDNHSAALDSSDRWRTLPAHTEHTYVAQNRGAQRTVGL